MSNKYLSKVPEGCREVFQEWIGGNVSLEDAILYVYSGEDAVIVAAFIGYTINFYRLFTIGGEWVISVDHGVPFAVLADKLEEHDEDW